RHKHEPEFDLDAVNIPVSTAGAEISTANPEVKTTGDSIEDIAAETLVYIKRSAAKAKDKGKMEKSESVMTMTKRQQEQERLGFEVVVRLQAELDKEERHRISRAEGLKTAGYRFTTAGSRLLLLMTTSIVTNSVFRGFFEKQKLTGPNFIDRYRQLRIVLSVEDKLDYLEQPIPPAPVPA
ncbi:hypothetical protein Tco_1423696, partial [Tanacetum coccineum]